ISIQITCRRKKLLSFFTSLRLSLSRIPKRRIALINTLARLLDRHAARHRFRCQRQGRVHRHEHHVGAENAAEHEAGDAPERSGKPVSRGALALDALREELLVHDRFKAGTGWMIGDMIIVHRIEADGLAAFAHTSALPGNERSRYTSWLCPRNEARFRRADNQEVRDDSPKQWRRRPRMTKLQ